MTDRWITLEDLSHETGTPAALLQHLQRTESSALPTRVRADITEYQQPHCAHYLTSRLPASASTDVDDGDIDEAKERARKMRADADRSELAAERLRGALAPVVEMDHAIERLASAVKVEIEGLRSRFVMRVIGLETAPEAAAVLDEMARQVLTALAATARAGAEDYDDIEEAA